MSSTMTTTIRHIGQGAAIFTAVAGAATATLGGLAYRFTCDTRSPLFVKNSQRANEAVSEQLRQSDNAEQQAASRWFHDTRQSWTTYSEDGLRLHAWVLDPDSAHPRPHWYAICCHGFCGEPQEMAKYALRYARMGCTVIVPAMRAHERSQGRYVGLGYVDRRDVMCWINLVVRADPDASIILHGNSMGAVAVMLAAAEPDIPRQVIAVVEDSGYSTIDAELRFVAKTMLKMPRGIGLQTVAVMNACARIHTKSDFRRGDCLCAARRMRVPLLCVHGTNDTMVPYEFMDRIVASYRGPLCRTFSVQGAGHTLSASTAPDAYWNAVRGFVEAAAGWREA